MLTTLRRVIWSAAFGYAAGRNMFDHSSPRLPAHTCLTNRPCAACERSHALRERWHPLMSLAEGHLDSAQRGARDRKGAA